MEPESEGKYVLRNLTELFTIDVYKKLDEVVSASKKDSPSILFFTFTETKGCTVLQDHNKQDKISNTNKNCFLEVCIQKD